jgi:hypothetical protein
MNLLQEVLNFVVELGVSIWGFICLVSSFLLDLLIALHGMPRLEGLLVGVLLAWCLSRRDKHPVLKALSAPLKLILDVLDLAWDQLVESVGDIWKVSLSTVKTPFVWAAGKGKWAYDAVVGGLSSLKVKLTKKKE